MLEGDLYRVSHSNQSMASLHETLCKIDSKFTFFANIKEKLEKQVNGVSGGEAGMNGVERGMNVFINESRLAQSRESERKAFLSFLSFLER